MDASVLPACVIYATIHRMPIYPPLDVIQVTGFRTVVNENAFPFFPVETLSSKNCFLREYSELGLIEIFYLD